MTGTHNQRFVPVAGFRALTGLYDPALTWLMRERIWKSRLVEQVAPNRGERILDLGSGTGTLTLMLQEACPSAQVVGVDIDPEIVERAQRKAEAAKARVTFRKGRADDPGLVASLGPASFDKVVSSLVFHHLDHEAKRRALHNTAALLRPGGAIHLADWGRPSGRLMRWLFYAVQILDGFANTSDNVLGLLPRMMEDAGFQAVRETRREPTALGSLSFYQGHQP